MHDRHRPHTDFPRDVAYGLQIRWVYRDGTRSPWQPCFRYFRVLPAGVAVRAYFPPAAVGLETRSAGARASASANRRPPRRVEARRRAQVRR